MDHPESVQSSKRQRIGGRMTNLCISLSSSSPKHPFLHTFTFLTLSGAFADFCHHSFLFPLALCIFSFGALLGALLGLSTIQNSGSMPHFEKQANFVWCCESTGLENAWFVVSIMKHKKMEILFAKNLLWAVVGTSKRIVILCPKTLGVQQCSSCTHTQNMQ